MPTSFPHGLLCNRLSVSSGRGGIGKRDGFRTRWAKALGGSSPLARIALAAAALLVAGIAHAATPTWRGGAPIPLARTEVAAARLGSEIVIVGGFLADGSSSKRVDAYSP